MLKLYLRMTDTINTTIPLKMQNICYYCESFNCWWKVSGLHCVMHKLLCLWKVWLSTDDVTAHNQYHFTWGFHCSLDACISKHLLTINLKCFFCLTQGTNTHVSTHAPFSRNSVVGGSWNSGIDEFPKCGAGFSVLGTGVGMMFYEAHLRKGKWWHDHSHWDYSHE